MTSRFPESIVHAQNLAMDFELGARETEVSLRIELKQRLDV